jgi:predicted dehydrogenase
MTTPPERTSSPSRRQFLAGSAASLAAASLLPAAVPARRGHGQAKIRVGLVGCGGRGTGAARQALATDGDVELTALGDAFADRVESSLANLRQDDSGVAHRVNVTPERCFIGFDAYRKVIDSGIDLVILATPPHFRPEHLAAAVAAKKHAFIEKPVAVDGHGVRSILATADLADQHGLCIGVGLQRHHHDGYLAALERVRAGAIGDIVAARVYWNMGSLWHEPRHAGWSDMEWQMRNWLYFTWLSGDHIVEQHIHNLDVVNWFKGAHPIRAMGMGGRQVRTGAEFGHIYDHHSVHFEYADGAWLFSQCRQIPGCANNVSEHLIGTRGRCDLNGAFVIDGQEKWRYRGKKNDPYQTEHDALFAAIRGGRPFNEARFGAESTLTAVMGRMATYTGKVIEWQEALQSERLGPDRYEFGDLPTPPVAMPGMG